MSHAQWQTAGPLCPDFLLLDARIHLETADGALSGTFERPLLLPSNASSASMEAMGFEDSFPQIELDEFTGTLDLGIDAERIYSGSILMSFSVGPDGISGRLGFYMWYREAGNARWLFTVREPALSALVLGLGVRALSAGAVQPGRTHRDAAAVEPARGC